MNYDEGNGKLISRHRIRETDNYFQGYVNTTKQTGIPPKHNPTQNKFGKMVMCPYARNLMFNGFPDAHPLKVWTIYNNIKRNIDLPGRFGDTPYQRFYTGQSSVRLTWRSLSVGVSS